MSTNLRPPMDWIILLLLILVLINMCSGCTGMRVEVEHTSHPLAGPPFGPRSEEDSLNTINVVKRVEKGRFYAEGGLGYKFDDGGFYGPPLTATVRVGVSLEPSK